MTSLKLSLPEAVRQFINEKVASGDYGTASEYIQFLVEEAQQREADQERLEALLLEGLDSGPGFEVTPQFWNDLHTELLERYPEPERS